MSEPRHCVDYLDDPSQPECLRRFLDYHCRPAALKHPTGNAEFDRWIEERHGLSMWRGPAPELYAEHEGRRVRIVMASRLGDVGITENLDADRGYDRRVALEELEGFAGEG